MSEYPGENHDEHTLYLFCSDYTEEQISSVIREAINKYLATLPTGHDINSQFKINIVTKHTGERLGHAYLFIRDKRLYWVLLGRNPDGSERVEYVDDQNWQPTESDDQSAVPIDPMEQNTDGLSWADLSELEDKYNQAMERKVKKVAPKIMITQDPLTTIPPIKLNEKQLQSRRSDEKEEVPTTEFMKIRRCIVFFPEEGRSKNVIKAKINFEGAKVEDLKAEDLKVMFSPYASDTKTLGQRNVNGIQRNEAYPWVDIVRVNNSRNGRDEMTSIVFVTFDPKTLDALFALTMVKRFEITVKGVKQTLYFDTAHINDRDFPNNNVRYPKGGKNDKKSRNDLANIPIKIGKQPARESGQQFKELARPVKLNNPFAALNDE